MVQLPAEVEFRTPHPKVGSQDKKDQHENPIHHEPTLQDRPGKFAPIASKILHMVLYGARVARKDLLRAVSNLARFINRWTVESDIKLKRLMDYIYSTFHWREVNWIGGDIEALSLDLFPDVGFGDAKRRQNPPVDATNALQALTLVSGYLD